MLPGKPDYHRAMGKADAARSRAASGVPPYLPPYGQTPSPPPTVKPLTSNRRNIVTPRRANGQGSIGRRHDGAYIVRVTDPATGRRRKRIVTPDQRLTAKAQQAEAEAVRLDMLDEVGSPLGRPSGQRRILQAAALWRQTGMPGDWLRFLNMLDKWIDQQKERENAYEAAHPTQDHRTASDDQRGGPPHH